LRRKSAQRAPSGGCAGAIPRAARTPRVVGKKSDADALDAELKRAKRLGGSALIDNSRETLAEFAKVWWDRYAVPNLQRHTLLNYASMLDVHIVPRLGDVRLHSLTPDLISQMRAEMATDRVGEPAIRKTLVLLQSILERAVEYGRSRTRTWDLFLIREALPWVGVGRMWGFAGGAGDSTRADGRWGQDRGGSCFQNASTEKGRRGGPNSLFHPARRLVGIVVLPDPQDCPARGDESSVICAIALDVSLQLLPPILAVGHRLKSMHRAAMPEAAVDEDRDASPTEHQVGPDTPAVEVEPAILSIAKTSRMYRGAQQALRSRVGAAIGFHRPPSDVAARRRTGLTHAAER
jgi:hypothetical protein